MAGNHRPYNRLERLYGTNPTKCLKVSKRYIKFLPDNPVAYYFASIVYRDKSKKHLEIKTRYMMMSKSIGYAMKFENFEDLDLELKIKWEGYLDELRVATGLLIEDLEQTQYGNLGDRLAIKHEKMIDNRDEILVAAGGTSGTHVPSLSASTSEDEEQAEASTPSPESAENLGYYGLASGRENAVSFNKASEQELLNLINEERKALFMSPLKLEEDLSRAARYHAHDMATQDYFYADSYDRVDGDLVLVADAKARIGQFHPEKHINSQNIANGVSDAQGALTQWMTYDEQYDVLYDESSRKVGIGICYDSNSTYGYYWVLVTAKR